MPTITAKPRISSFRPRQHRSTRHCPTTRPRSGRACFGQGNAAAFNRFHWLYYNRDVFDLYYPGYWDSWPSLHGSAGMTFESDGGGKRGFNWKRDDGTIETLRNAIAKHFTASLATLETSAAHREDRLRDYYHFFTTAISEAQAAKDGVRQVAIAPGSDPGVAAELVANLLRQGIEVRRTSEKFTLANAHDYLPGENSAGAKTREFPPGSYVVDLAQPQGRMARTLLAPDAPLDPAFVKRQYERQARNLRRGRREPLENAEFYDITAWCLPMVFGVDAAYSAEAPASPAPGGFVRQASEVGLTLSDQAAPGGQEHMVSLVPPPPAAPAVTAYLWTPETEGAYRLAFRLLQEGYRIATSTYPLRAGWPGLSARDTAGKSRAQSVHPPRARQGTRHGTGRAAQHRRHRIRRYGQRRTRIGGSNFPQGPQGSTHRWRWRRADLLRRNLLSVGQEHGRGIRADEHRSLSQNAHGGFQRAHPA